MIRGAIYKIDLGDAKRGHEQRGHRFGLVISENPQTWTVTTIIPTSTGAQPSIFRPEIEIDGTAALLLVDQIRTLDLGYVRGGPVMMLNRYDLARVEDVLMRFLGLGLGLGLGRP